VRTVDTQLRGLQAIDGRLPPSTPRRLAERSFRQSDIPVVRLFAQEFGGRAGIEPGRLTDFVLAVSEAAACAVAPGPGTARIRLWTSGARAFCEVRGDGRRLQAPPGTTSARPAGPARRPGEEEALRHFVLKQLSDYVSVASGPDGARVLLSMTVS
jgi:anti-sigma regulatory factor (Ser/Thr protein kinase)